MNNLKIHKALDRKLEEVATLLGLPVAWDNVSFDPPASGMFLEADFLPAENEDFTFQGTVSLRRGVYQVTVVYPIDSGSQAAENTCSKIVDAFRNNLAIPTDETPVYVNGEPSVFSGIRDGTAYRVPISIAYAVTA